MGTNFYFSTTNKELAHKFDYRLTDEPDFHYEIHLAKTSYGWLPLFQSHKDTIQSVDDIKKVYYENKDEIKLVDEYNEEYDWNSFDDRVLKFNGGVYGGIKRYKLENDPKDKYYDPYMPKTGPISHIEYMDRHPDCKEYSKDLFKDEKGYEFCKTWFA